MVEATAFNNMQSKSPSMSSYPSRFHPNPPIGSNFINGFLFTHLRSLNVLHFGMAEVTNLKK
jgi:hypothetical protein